MYKKYCVDYVAILEKLHVIEKSLQGSKVSQECVIEKSLQGSEVSHDVVGAVIESSKQMDLVELLRLMEDQRESKKNIFVKEGEKLDLPEPKKTSWNM